MDMISVAWVLDRGCRVVPAARLVPSVVPDLPAPTPVKVRAGAGGVLVPLSGVVSATRPVTVKVSTVVVRSALAEPVRLERRRG